MENRKLSRRDFLRLSAAAATGAIVAACAPAAPQVVEVEKEVPVEKVVVQTVEVEKEVVVEKPVKAAGPVGLRLSAWGDITDKMVYDSMAAKFLEVQPDIRVMVEQYPGGYYEKIQANFAGGNSADLLYFQGWSWQPFADKEQLVPLDEYIQTDNFTKAWPDIENYRHNCMWHGKTYMSSVDTGSVVMFYNKELFDKRGVPYPEEGWSYADFQEAVAKLSFEEGGIKYYGYAQAGGWNGCYLRSLHWMRKDGVLEWDRIVEPKEAKFTQPEIIEGLQYTIYEVIDKEYCPSPAAIAGGGITIATGRVGMTMEGPWFLANMYGEKAAVEGGVRFDVAEPPLGDTGKDETIAEVHGHVITRQSKIPDAAWELMKFMCDDEGQKMIAEGGRMCNRPETIEKYWVPIATETYNFENGMAFGNAMKTGLNPIFSGAGCNYDAIAGAGTPLAVAWDAMLGVQKTAKEAMEEANPKLQKILDDYWAKKG